MKIKIIKIICNQCGKEHQVTSNVNCMRCWKCGNKICSSEIMNV